MRSKQERDVLLKRFGCKYRRFFFRDEGDQVCTYCGNIGDTADHVPALEWVYSLGTSYFEEAGIAFMLVPACRECNSTLADRKLFSIVERARYLLGKYSKKYRRFARNSIWDEEELHELGFGLRGTVEGFRTCQIGIDRRIRIIEETMRGAGVLEYLPAAASVAKILRR